MSCWNPCRRGLLRSKRAALLQKMLCKRVFCRLKFFKGRILVHVTKRFFHFVLYYVDGNT